MVRNLSVVQLPEQEMAVSGDALLGQIKDHGIAAAGVVLLRKSQGPVSNVLPELRGPRLIARLVFFGILCPDIQRSVHAHFHSGPGLALSGLVHQKGAAALLQEQRGPAVPSSGVVIQPMWDWP